MSDEKVWLERTLEHLGEQARRVLGMLEQRKTLESGEELDTLEGDLYANIHQLELDARHAREASDAYTDSLDDEEAPRAVSV